MHKSVFVSLFFAVTMLFMMGCQSRQEYRRQELINDANVLIKKEDYDAACLSLRAAFYGEKPSVDKSLMIKTCEQADEKLIPQVKQLSQNAAFYGTQKNYIEACKILVQIDERPDLYRVARGLYPNFDKWRQGTCEASARMKAEQAKEKENLERQKYDELKSLYVSYVDRLNNEGPPLCRSVSRLSIDALEDVASIRRVNPNSISFQRSVFNPISTPGDLDVLVVKNMGIVSALHCDITLYTPTGPHFCKAASDKIKNGVVTSCR